MILTDVLELHETFDLTHLQVFLAQPVLQFLQQISMIPRF